MALARTRQCSTNLLVLYALLGLATPRPGAAQLGSTFSVEDRQAALARVPMGQVIRLRLANGAQAGGPVVRWNTFSVTLGPYIGYAEQDTAVALQSIDSLWVRDHATRRGTLYGAVTGLALGVVLGSTAGSLCPVDGWKRPCAQGIVTSAVGGALIGSVFGIALGSGTPRWRRLHPQGRQVLPPAGAPVTLEAAGEATEPDPRALALIRTRPGALVRLRFTGRRDLAGYVGRAGARRVIITPVIGADSTSGPIELGSVDGIWEQGTAQQRGSIVGALVGFGAGLYVTGRSRSCDAPGRCGVAGLGASGLLGGAVGWFLGGSVGSLIPRWERRL